MKTCAKCGETKPTSQFSKRASKRDGLQTQCKVCVGIAYAKWRAANTERIKEYQAKWYAANSEKVKASRNPEEVMVRNAEYYAANKDRLKAYNAEWWATHPEARRINEQNRRARKRANGGNLSSDLSVRLFKLQRGKCACGCGQPLGTDYHLDHIMPLALGGSNTDDNIQLLRALCNKQKSAKHPVVFMQQRGFLL